MALDFGVTDSSTVVMAGPVTFSSSITVQSQVRISSETRVVERPIIFREMGPCVQGREASGLGAPWVLGALAASFVCGNVVERVRRHAADYDVRFWRR